MFQHNLTISLRNLCKYKLQTAISIASIAIGIVTLAAVHGVLQQHFRPMALSTMPYYDRAYRMYLDYISPQEDRYMIESNAVRALTENGGLRSVELGPTSAEAASGWCAYVVYTQGDTLERKHTTELSSIEPLYPHYAGYRSALTGQRIAPMRPGEAIIGESQAKIIFGDVNPVGATVQGAYALNVSHTIVDVYRDMSQYDTPPGPSALLYALDNVEGIDKYRALWLNVVLKPGYTTWQLETEANVRLKPLGLKASVELVKEARADDLRLFAVIHTLAYFFGSLILLAAGIGFLRMQVQLFWMRKREVSLRIVNGAKRWQLFVLQMTEVALVVCCAVVLAMLLGSWLEQFMNTWVASAMRQDHIVAFRNLPQYAMFIGTLLLLLCSLIVWLTLQRICRSAQGLAAAMRGSRSHTFRNVMLWVQVFVAVLFMCITFTITQICTNEVAQWVMPDDETPYKKSLLITSDVVEDRTSLYVELEKLPEVAQVHPYYSNYECFEELEGKDSLKLLYGNLYFNTYMISDTAFLDYYRVQVSWHEPALKHGPCVLIDESLYPDLERAGALNSGLLTVMPYGRKYPVAGTFSGIPFESKIKGHDSRHEFIFIDNGVRDKKRISWILAPKAGRYQELLRSVNSTIARVEPTIANRLAYNLYEQQTMSVGQMRNLRLAAWILGVVALLVCVMGIYSAIALDTRARHKEMAIRKINGAKSWDIAHIFVRLYVVLLVLAIALILPLAVLVQAPLQALDPSFKELSLALPVLAGCLLVVLAIVLIVGWHVHGIMRVNPAEIIAKE